jgi:hypothetical protein
MRPSNVEAMLDEVRRTGMRCSACGATYHETSGHRLSARTQLCGGCAQSWQSWLRCHLERRWNGLNLYEYAATSIRPPLARE